MGKKRHPCSSILPGGPPHHWNDAESKKRREYADHHENTTLTIHDTTRRFHIEPGKVADLIVNGALEIKGFTTKFWPFPEDVVGAQDEQDRVGMIIDDLKVLLVSRKEFQDTIIIDSEIIDLLSDVFFDRKQLVNAITNNSSDSPTNIKGDNRPHDPLESIGGTSDSQEPPKARGVMLAYAKKRMADKKTLVAADFSDNTTDRNILDISSKYEIRLDTLMRYTRDAGFLAPSKQGRKRKP